MSDYNIKQNVMDAMKVAMKAHDKLRLAAIRLIQASFKQKEVDSRIELDNVMALQILDKMLKQRRDSIEQYQAANRQDLADKEAFEIEVIQSFMPVPLTAEEISAAILQAIEATSAQTMRDMAKVIEILKPKLQGRADMGEVSKMVKNKLAI